MSARAPSLARRNLQFLLALLPGAGVLVLAQPALGLRMAVAATIALLVDALCLRLRRQPVRAHLAEGSALRAALLLSLWFPAIGWQALAGALLFGIVGARHALGGLGASPFAPALAAAAFAQAAFAVAPPALDAGGPWAALAWLAGGLALVATGQVRWQSPACLLAAALLASLPFERGLALVVSAPWLLLAFFAWPEPATHGEGPWPRALAAAGVGALAVLAAAGTSPRWLPFAVLAANAAVPALEARFGARPRPVSVPA